MNDKKIEELYVKYCPMVFKCCRKILKNEEKAEDAMQDVLIKFIDIISKKKIKDIGPYLVKMTKHRCLDLLKKDRNIVDNVDLLSFITDKNDIANIVVDKIIDNQFLDRLDNIDKTIVRLHYSQGHKQKEMARILGISERAIRARVNKIKKIAHSIKEQSK